MKFIDLFESRRNPDRNPKQEIGHKAAVNYILENIPKDEIDHWGVSMTQLPKLGINPKSSYDTPIGVYFYPASYYLQIKNILPFDAENMDRSLPFQDNAPYIQAFKIEGNILDLSDLELSDGQKIISKLKELYPNNKDFITEMSKVAASRAKVQTIGGMIWYIMYAMASSPLISETNEPIIWNKIIRQLGYDAVVDYGDGIIHENEKCQGFVANPKAIVFRKQFEQTLNIKKIITNKLKTAIDTGKRLSPKLERTILRDSNTDPLQLYYYAKNIIKGRWKEAEHHFIQKPAFAKQYAIDVIKGRFIEAEPYILNAAKQLGHSLADAINYTAKVYGSRWIELEDILFSKTENYKQAVYYAENVMNFKYEQTAIKWVREQFKEHGVEL